MVEPKDTVQKEVNGYILPPPPSTSRAEDRNRKSKFNICKYLGFQGKTFWDWLDLLLAPFLVSFLLLLVGVYFDGRAKDREEYLNLERNKQDILRSYLTTMTDLVSEGKFSDQNKTELTNQAAKALTQSALTSFDQAVFQPESLQNFEERALTQAKQDAKRKGQVLSFLYNAELITTNNSPKINMEGIDLTGANLENFGFTPTGQQKQPFIINLSGANLYKANLDKARLVKGQMKRTQLPQAQLKGADLKTANLEEANLQRANLTGANLEGANLYHADLTGANLTNANLSGGKSTRDAKLIGAILKGARLIGADLSNAHLNGADLTDADFSNAQGLETADMQKAKFCRTTMPERTVRSDDCPKPAKP